MEWLTNNAGSLLVIGVLLVLVGLVIRKMIRDRKQGRSSCGCGCSGCALSGSCSSKGRSMKKSG